MNSQCVNGFLHDFQIKMYYPDGLLEVCEKCHHKQLFRNDIPNQKYLLAHQRMALQKWMPRYQKEYAKK
jgi:hypothetical protein